MNLINLDTCKLEVETYTQEGNTLQVDCFIDPYDNTDVIPIDKTVDLAEFQAFCEQTKRNYYWLDDEWNKFTIIPFEHWFSLHERDVIMFSALEDFINTKEGRTEDYYLLTKQADNQLTTVDAIGHPNHIS